MGVLIEVPVMLAAVGVVPCEQCCPTDVQSQAGKVSIPAVIRIRPGVFRHSSGFIQGGAGIPIWDQPVPVHYRINN